MKPKVLILDCDCAAGVECIQSLGKAGAWVHASCRDPRAIAFCSRYLERTFVQPDKTRPLAQWIVDLDTTENYDLIVPTTEISLLALIDHSVPEAIYEKACLAHRDNILLSLDKEKVYRLAAELGLRVPESALIINKIQAAPAEFPVVLKPISSKVGSEHGIRDLQVTIARNQEQWLHAIDEQYRGIHVQQQRYISGNGVGVEALFERGEARWIFMHERVHELPLTGGGSSYRRSIPIRHDLVDASTRLLRALSWHGVAMVEWKVVADGTAFLMEMNPRLWGSLALAIDCGVDYPNGLLKLAMGEALESSAKYKKGYYTRNLRRDIEWLKANARADHSDPLLLTRPRIHSFLELFRPLVGKESWDFFDLKDIRVTEAVLKALLKKEATALVRNICDRVRNAYLKNFQQPHLIRKLAKINSAHKIIFVCHGNICRSPFAQQLASVLRNDIEFESAGFYPELGRRSPKFMQRIAVQYNFALEKHRSKILDVFMAQQADLIVIMDQRNRQLMKKHFPQYLGKTVHLGMFASPSVLEIKDPYELSLKEAEQVARDLVSAVTAFCHWQGLRCQSSPEGNGNQREQP